MFPLPLSISPTQALARWPRAWPLACLWAAAPDASGRYLLLARPTADRAGPDAASLRSLLPPTPIRFQPDQPPGPGWALCLPYELASAFEPTVARVLNPAVWWALRCDHGLWYDTLRHQWWSMGWNPASNDPDFTALHAALHIDSPSASAGHRFDVRSVTPQSTAAADFQAAVRRAVEYIRAGDIYQVNLSHALRAQFTGSLRSAAQSLLPVLMPWYGSLLTRDLAPGKRQAVLSLSPELFLSYDPLTRRVNTRPMKGTRPFSPAAATELATSSKDAAELAMIVDLMRNDLGRVCTFGSMRVETPRTLEHHGGSSGVVQATAIVSGTLRADLTSLDLLAAAFPAGSVTGAPKIRAMQIIAELEQAPRGPYCGSLGFLADSGALQLNVAIRTAAISGAPGLHPDDFSDAALEFRVGAGIVSDSLPEAEWQETLAKAHAFRALLAASFANQP